MLLLQTSATFSKPLIFFCLVSCQKDRFLRNTLAAYSPLWICLSVMISSCCLLRTICSSHTCHHDCIPRRDMQREMRQHPACAMFPPQTLIILSGSIVQYVCLNYRAAGVLQQVSSPHAPCVSRLPELAVSTLGFVFRKMSVVSQWLG